MDAALSPAGDRKILGIALAIAVAIHALFLLLNLPDARNPIPARPARTEPPQIHDTVLLPPPIERPRPPRPRSTPQALIPGPEVPSVMEPEYENPVEVDSDSPEVDLVFPPPVAPTVDPRDAGPRIITGEIEPPVLIAESKIPPIFPEAARLARISGRVILRAVILADGSVAEVEVLSCGRPGLGFEEASVAAVSEWRYEPATLSGRPIDVYFSIQVVFELN